MNRFLSNQLQQNMYTKNITKNNAEIIVKKNRLDTFSATSGCTKGM